MVVVARLAFIEIDKGRAANRKTGYGSPMYIVANSLKRLQRVLDRGMPCLLAHILLRKPADELRGVLSLFHDNLGVSYFKTRVLQHVELGDAKNVVIRVHAIV